MRRLLLPMLIAALAAPAVQAQAPYSRFDGAPAAPADDTAAQAAGQAWMRRSADALAATGQPRELALAAVLRDIVDRDGRMPDTDAPSRPAVASPQAAAWRRDAAARAGDDVLANALLTYGADEATRLRAAQRWLGSDARNLAPLLVRGGGADALLADARAATRFDHGMLDQVRWMQTALLRTPPTADERRTFADGDDFVPAEHAAIVAMSLWSAYAMPNIQPLLQACDPAAAGGDATRLRDCRHIGTVMADASDTRIGQLFGFAILRRIASTPADQAAVDARRRTYDWQMYEWGRVTEQAPRDGADRFVRDLADASIRDEHALIARALHEAGVAPEPPADWQAPRY